MTPLLASLAPTLDGIGAPSGLERWLGGLIALVGFVVVVRNASVPFTRNGGVGPPEIGALFVAFGVFCYFGVVWTAMEAIGYFFVILRDALRAGATA